MIFVTGGFLVLINFIVNLTRPEVAIPTLAIIGIVFGMAVTQHIAGTVAGLASGAIIGALGESAKNIITTQGISGVEGFLLANMFLWVGLLLFAAGFSSQAS